LLYGPIVRAMRAREERIAERLNEAEQNRKDAEEKAERYAEKKREIERNRDELIQEAREEASQERQRLLKESRQEVDRQRRQWRQALQRDQEDFVADLRRQAAELSLHAARRALAELADEDLEDRMYRSFRDRFDGLSQERLEELRHHLGDGEANINFRSSFEVSDERKQEWADTIRQTLDTEAKVAFEHVPDLICGIELDVGGYSFGWNVKEFLHDLDGEFMEHLRSES
jgi:F-type H+-transporting ATPase subunit b